jgi:L-threonylcarbamoyladenylate synthase
MRIIPLDKKNEITAVLETVSVLKNGGVAIIPTDTVYGIVADACNKLAVDKVFKIKMRINNIPLPVFVSDFSMMDRVAVASQPLKDYIESFGSVTAVLPARGWVPLTLRGGKLTVGVRIPQHIFVKKILDTFNGPITGTSANLSGRGPYIKIQDVINEFEGGHEPDLIIDAGDLPPNSSSAVLDFTTMPPRVLRLGALHKDKLMALLQNTTP